MVANIEEVLQRGESLSGEYRCKDHRELGTNCQEQRNPSLTFLLLPFLFCSCLRGVYRTFYCEASPTFLTSTEFYCDIFFPLSSWHKSQQSDQPVEEVPQRCQISQHPLHVCQSGCGVSVLNHTHHLRALLVALMDRQGLWGSSTVKSHLNRSGYVLYYTRVP